MLGVRVLLGTMIDDDGNGGDDDDDDSDMELQQAQGPPPHPRTLEAWSRRIASFS